MRCRFYTTFRDGFNCKVLAHINAFLRRNMVSSCLAITIRILHGALINRLTRISIALAIARVFSIWEPSRKFAIGLTLLFATFFVVISGYFVKLCSKKNAIQVFSSGQSSSWNAQCGWTDELKITISVGQSRINTMKKDTH